MSESSRSGPACTERRVEFRFVCSGEGEMRRLCGLRFVIEERLPIICERSLFLLLSARKLLPRGWCCYCCWWKTGDINFWMEVKG